MDGDMRDVIAHLEKVQGEPSTPINEELLKQLQRKCQTDAISSDDRLKLMSHVVPLISQLQQDPAPLTELTRSLLASPERPSFLQIMSLKPEIDLVAGLKTPNEAINLLTLRLLTEARSSADVGLVASKLEVVLALVELWLFTLRPALAEQTEHVLTGLLGAESPIEEDGSRGSVESFPTHEAVLPTSTSLMWRRIFKDRDVYGTIFATCSMKTLGQPGQLDKARKTIAQARLLGLLKRILYAPQLWESQIADVEREYGVAPGAGLLDFALRKMVDWEDDMLMHISLIDFYTTFVSYDGPHGAAFENMTVPTLDKHPRSSLEVMQAAKLHDWTMSFYLTPSPTDPLSEYLYGPAAGYVSSYARTYPAHFRTHAARDVLRKASTALSNTRPSAWANNRAPSHDIKLLAQIPRHVLLGVDSGQVVSLLPVKPANADALNALARIFHGPLPSEETQNGDTGFLLASTSAHLVAERAAARALFVLYVAQRSDFWKDVTTTADIAANVETAEAAIHLIHTIAVANWAALPGTPPSSPPEASETVSPLSSLPTESQLRSLCPRYYPAQPSSGAIILISEPAIAVVLPWLVSGPPARSSVTNTADPDAYRLAVAKHAILGDLRERMWAFAEGGAGGNAIANGQQIEPPAAWNEVLDVLERRQRMGPMGTSGAQSGSVRVPNPEVGTMEL